MGGGGEGRVNEGGRAPTPHWWKESIHVEIGDD